MLGCSDLKPVLSPEDLARFEARAGKTTLTGGGTLLDAIAGPHLVQHPAAADVPQEVRALTAQLQRRLQQRGQKSPGHAVSALEGMPALPAVLFRDSSCPPFRPDEERITI